jgi:hypothetical protein
LNPLPDAPPEASVWNTNSTDLPTEKKSGGVSPPQYLTSCRIDFLKKQMKLRLLQIADKKLQVMRSNDDFTYIQSQIPMTPINGLPVE